jgi:tripartite-type tricarboxylate transporter receptor subunit TctC
MKAMKYLLSFAKEGSSSYALQPLFEKEQKRRFHSANFWATLLRNLAMALVVLSAVSLHAQVPFYQGKTITVIVSSDAGGTSDLRVKSLVPYLQKHIPGNPTVVLEYMPGGGGRKAANHVFRSAKPDGLIIGSMGTTLLAAAIQNESGVLYDLNKFVYLGSSDATTQHIFLTRKEAGLSSLDKLRGASGLRIGAQAIGHNIYITGRLFAFFLNLKDAKMVVGYSGPEVDLALLRGEVDARSSLIASIVQRTPEWVDRGLVDFHAVIETPRGNRHPRFAHLPELETFAKSDRERKVLELQRAIRLGGSAIVLPPNTPRDKVEILQAAMRKALNDPAFSPNFRKIVGEDPTPLMPEELQKVIQEVPREPEVIALFNKIAGGERLPDR